MSLFDVIKYPLSDPPSMEQVSSIPSQVLDVLNDSRSPTTLYYQILYQKNHKPKLYKNTMTKIRKALVEL